MAERKDTRTAPNDAQNEASRALADAAEEAAARRMDETEDGGRYLVNDQLVDANGEPIKERRGAAKADDESEG